MATSTICLCANNCGSLGNPMTLNLCSKCYVRHVIKKRRRTETPKSNPASSFAVLPDQDGVVSSDTTEPALSGPSRCVSCRKRVGLTGFKCRCGSTYCGTHRYPEKHSCCFDFKAPGKSAIAKANPLVKAAKLENKL